MKNERLNHIVVYNPGSTVHESLETTYEELKNVHASAVYVSHNGLLFPALIHGVEIPYSKEDINYFSSLDQNKISIEEINISLRERADQYERAALENNGKTL